MTAKAIAAVTDRPLGSGGQPLYAPVKRGITAPDDDDALSFIVVGTRHHIINPATIPRLGPRLRQPSGGKRTDTGRNDHRFRRELIRRGFEHERSILLAQ